MFSFFFEQNITDTKKKLFFVYHFVFLILKFHIDIEFFLSFKRIKKKKYEIGLDGKQKLLLLQKKEWGCFYIYFFNFYKQY